jgi:hypothetical protein
VLTVAGLAERSGETAALEADEIRGGCRSVAGKFYYLTAIEIMKL